MKIELTLNEAQLHQFVEAALMEAAKRSLRNQLEAWDFQSRLRKEVNAALESQLTEIVATIAADVPELESRVRNSLVNKITNKVIKEAAASGSNND